MDVAARVARALIGRAVELPPPIAARFPELREASYRRGGLPPRIGGWCLFQSTAAAITLWNVVWLAPETACEPWLLLHELGHVRQFRSARSFPLRYLWESVRRGYAHNRYERDADAFAAARQRAAAAGSPLRSPAQDA